MNPATTAPLESAGAGLFAGPWQSRTTASLLAPDPKALRAGGSFAGNCVNDGDYWWSIVSKRFYNELESGYPNGSTLLHDCWDGNMCGDAWRNTTRGPSRATTLILRPALNEGSAEPDFSAGLVRATDAKALERENITDAGNL